jgi:uncharacterized membrane protein
MTNLNKNTIIMTLSLLPILALVGCQGEQQVSFAQDVQPIIQKHCIECHASGGKGYEASGFAMDSYEGLMKGTRNGPMIIAGDSEGSNMLVLMEGRADPSISMPHGKMEGATGKELETIRLWINQGAKNN